MEAPFPLRMRPPRDLVQDMEQLSVQGFRWLYRNPSPGTRRTLRVSVPVSTMGDRLSGKSLPEEDSDELLFAMVNLDGRVLERRVLRGYGCEIVAHEAEYLASCRSRHSEKVAGL